MVSTMPGQSDSNPGVGRRKPITNDELLKKVLESREKFKRTVAATISRKNVPAYNNMFIILTHTGL
jgi:hypothetical protein